MAIEYFGKNFSGWQVQPGKRTVQAELEKAFAVALRQPVQIIASGRTDAGVHARGQVAHFDADINSETLNLEKIQRSINALTDWDVSIRALESCEEDFHSRYHAQYRHYIYSICLGSSPLMQGRVWEVPFAMDFSLFEEELSCFLGKHDFNSFSIPRNDGKSTECEIQQLKLSGNKNLWQVEITGNRFLHRMVRSMVGACYDVARKNRNPGFVKAILEGSNKLEWTWAPAEGLVLEKVGYSDYEY